MSVALAKAGRQAEAEALVARTPDCYECLRARGRVATIGRDWAEAERWLQAAVRRGPETPFAYFNLAEARFARGDLDGAREALRSAREHGPRWADPLKLEGEILLRRGDERGAARRFRDAAELAPRWGELHLRWGDALEAQGRREQARVLYRRAAGMDLSTADRAEVGRRLGG
jgi:tetratricopeptide (TPR) repeat protein